METSPVKIGNDCWLGSRSIILSGVTIGRGVTIAAGTDVTSDRFNTVTPMVHHEMQLLVERAGLTPLEALQAATINGAKVIGIEKQTGSIRAGKTANLVVLNSDPSIEITNSQNIVHVIKNGQFIHLGDNEKLPFEISDVFENSHSKITNNRLS